MAAEGLLSLWSNWCNRKGTGIIERLSQVYLQRVVLFLSHKGELWRPICRQLLGVKCGNFLPEAKLRENLGHHWVLIPPCLSAYCSGCPEQTGQRSLLLSSFPLRALCSLLRCLRVVLSVSKEQVHHTIWKRPTKRPLVAVCIWWGADRSLSLQIWEKNEKNLMISASVGRSDIGTL